MRILFLSTWFPWPPDNGSKIRVYHLSRILGQRHEVTLIAFAFGTAEPESAPDLDRFCANVQTVAIDPFIENRAGSLRTFMSIRPVASRPIPAMTHLVGKLLDQDPFDVVIASTEIMAGYALMFPPGTVKVLEEHNSMTRWMRERYAEQTKSLQRVRCWASWQKRRRYEAGYYGQFDLITMVSEEDRTTTIATIENAAVPIEVIPNGVDCGHNRPNMVQARPASLVYSGALTYSANYDAMSYFLADIYPLIKQQAPDVSLTITGSLTGVDLTGLALDGSICLSGHVHDIRAPVAGARVCVVPIRQGGGTRLKILEAMALGTPVVSTTKGAEGLDVTHGKDILIADGPAEFADTVMRLLQDHALRQQLARSARRLVEKRYDWNEIGQRFVAMVEDVAGRPGSPRTSAT